MSMKKENRQIKEGGFTLIELLVVVLIIGILASVALPQYQKAVDQSRFTQLVTAATSLKQAEERLFLASGKYTNNINDLDIKFNAANLQIGLPTPEPTLNNPAILWVKDTRLPGVAVYFGMEFSNNSFWNSRRMCYAYKTSPRGIKLCQHIAKKKNADMEDSGFYKYSFKG